MASISQPNITSLQELKAHVQKNGKNTILILSSVSCPPCQELARLLEDWENEDEIFIVMLKYPGFNDMKQLMESYESRAFPTIVLVDKDFNTIDKFLRYRGFQSFEEFVVSNMRHFRLAMRENKKLCIALVSDCYYPSTGGIETHIRFLANQLQALGHKTIIITNAYYAPSKVPANVYALDIPILARNISWPSLFSNFPVIYTILKSNNVDVVHAHQTMSALALEAIWHANTMGLRTVFTEHSLFEVKPIENVVVNSLARMVLKNVRSVNVSVCSLNVYKNRVGNDENEVVYNAVDGKLFFPHDVHGGRCGMLHRSSLPSTSRLVEPVCDCFLKEGIEEIFRGQKDQDDFCQAKENYENSKNTKKSSYETNHNSNYEYEITNKENIPPSTTQPITPIINILVMSRLVFRKGINILTTSIPLIIKRCPSARIYIIGTGPEQDKLEQIIDEHELHSRVSLVGDISHAQVGEWLRYGHIFVNTSLTESFCMAVVEAAMCGMHVVSTNVGAIHEVLKEDVTFVKMCGYDVADKVCKIVEDLVDEFMKCEGNCKENAFNKHFVNENLLFRSDTKEKTSLAFKCMCHRRIYNYKVYTQLRDNYNAISVINKIEQIYLSLIPFRLSFRERFLGYENFYCRFLVVVEYLLYYIICLVL